MHAHSKSVQMASYVSVQEARLYYICMKTVGIEKIYIYMLVEG